MDDLLIAGILTGDVDGLRELLHSPTTNRKFLNVVFHDGSTPLNLSIANRVFDVAQMFIEYGSDVNLPDSFRVDGCRRKPIHYACAAGNLDLVRPLVEMYEVDVDDVEDGNSTPIHYAAVAGHIEIVEYLVKFGCNIHHRSNSGKTALWKAAVNGHREIVHLLYTLGVDINIQNQVGETVLFECCKKIRLIALVTDLILFGANLSVLDVERNSVLHLAAVVGNTLAVDNLISSGAELDAQNEYGNTPLHNAVMHGQIASALALLNYGAKTNTCNFSGQSIIYVAMLHQQKKTCHLLCLTGVKLTANDKEMFERYEYHRNNEKRIFYHWLNNLFNNPVDLMSICRIAIRHCLESSPHKSVPLLPLPPSIHQFLLLDDIISYF